MKNHLSYILILGLGVTSGLQAKSNGKGKGHDGEKKETKESKGKDDNDKHDNDHKDWKHARFSDTDQQVVHEYIRDHQKKTDLKSLPPGLAKKVARGESLPPGWQKKIARGEVMPLTVYQQVEPVPQVVLVKMAPQPAGTRLGVLDGKLVRLADSTHTILDVFNLVP